MTPAERIEQATEYWTQDMLDGRVYRTRSAAILDGLMDGATDLHLHVAEDGTVTAVPMRQFLFGEPLPLWVDTKETP